MSAVARLFANLLDQENEKLRRALADISGHIGGSPGLPWTVVEAAESTRSRLNLLMGHWDIPRDADGAPVPFCEVGR